MIKLINSPVLYEGGKFKLSAPVPRSPLPAPFKNTISYSILNSHNTLEKTERFSPLRLKFDAACSHDITYVGIIQSAKAVGLEEFPIPYIMTNCHNSLSAVGGTINEDDHIFGLTAAKNSAGFSCLRIRPSSTPI
jgi:hypothetical protein